MTPVQPISEQHQLVRKRQFDNDISLSDIVRLLRSTHATGHLGIDFSQGGVCAISFEEKQHLNNLNTSSSPASSNGSSNSVDSLSSQK